ncbi:MAG: hypothetical protein A2Y12_16215 [Planctomycetes bacterium GWF2_42_9]|nr:MAG: hypothetical protein A2Y12_16215 [Planctomycetes bacterium GWF2_42_9]HAL44922.1 hypothetical protein [Phycisphaerales bacterium]
MRRLILCLLIAVNITSGNAFAYWSGSLGTKHEEIAEYLLEYPTIAPYIAELVRYYNIDVDDIVATADSEPDPHHGWAFIDSSGNLTDTPVTSYSIGMILHAAADGSVASKHEPAILENDWAHHIWEATAEILSLPSLSYTADVLMGSYSKKMDDIYAQQIDLGNRYKDWYEDQIFPTSAPHNQISEGLDNSLQMGEAALKEFFDDHEILCPSYIVADWRFDEDSGQYAYTSKGKISIDLQLGSSIGTDTSDPEWADGFYRTGAIRTKKYSANGASNYVRNFSDKLTAYECGKLAPSGSYTIEVIFSPASFPNYSTYDSDHPMCLLKCTDVSDGGECQYVLSLLNNSFMHRCVRFYANHADGTSTSFVYDIQAVGITITPGKWYYVCVTFDSTNNEMTTMVRDLQTGVRYVGVTTSKPLVGWTANPDPVFIIGSEYTGSGGRCFDGRIDRVRLSNTRLSYARRLYLYPTLAYWTFDENTGQITANTNGATDANLQFGSMTSVDNSDPTWSTGLSGSCMKGNKYTANNISVYSMNSDWALKDTELISPGNSYAIEMIINPTSWPMSATYDANHPMGLLRYYDSADGKTRYLIRLLNSSSLKRCVSFYAIHSDGTSTSYTFNAQNAGVTITPGNWYYIGVIYNDYPAGAGTLELIVRDMTTGYTVSGSTTSKPLMAMSDDPNPKFTVGSEYLSGGRCFDGKIDELRISDMAIADSARLYGGLKVGDWGLFKADFNSDGYVDDEDLYYIAHYWLKASPSAMERLDTDNFINMKDYAGFLNEWLKCSDPANGNCTHILY